ncbi:hypothetical protein RB653_001137 [Dictyostelium firmibasis]|uniref:Malonyl-CoA:ACP transacylase (MAT) domain-containing protein n=1 Tax=Dictyostelium firmibasis TaxID=79012 RepID=A0AAN7TWE8_9MYCE
MNSIEETPIVIYFCGQAVQWKTMALKLYNENSIFRESMDKIDNYLKNNYFNGESMLNKLRSLNDDEGTNNEDQILTHSILFMFQSSLFELFKSEGINPSFIFGISCGEMASLYCSGALSLQKVCDLLIERAKLMDKAMKINPNGFPIFVKIEKEEFNENYSKRYPEIEISAKFSNNSLLLATCNSDQNERFCQEIKEKEIFLRPIPSKIAFHTSAMDCIEEEAQKVKEIEFSANSFCIPTYCSYNGKLYDESNSYNVFKSIRNCVEANIVFQDILKSLESNGFKKVIFVEITPHPILTPILFENVKSIKSSVFTTISNDDPFPNVISLSSLNKSNDDIVHINSVLNTIKKHTK